jgi:HAD superfamily hydrolase (TIGR01450 family)
MESIRVVVFDMDGVLRIGSDPIDGASEVLRKLRDANVRICISTNECRYSAAELREDLSEMGVMLPDDTFIYTAGMATRDYLNRKLQRFPDEKFSVGIVGETGLHDVIGELTENPNFQVHTLPPKYKTRRYLVMGTVDRIKIATLDKARKWIREGCRVITTCCDLSDPSSKGDFTLGMPGHMLHILSYNDVGAKTAYSTGKPHPIHAQAILARFPDVKPEEVLFVGDTLYTDVRLAEEAGFRSALVMTGNTKREALQTYVVEPDHVLRSIRDLPDLLGVSSITN